MIGIIYHVIEKDTNRVIKVGSTIRALTTRWRMYDKKRYSNHFLKEVKRIESNELDLYDPRDSFCPFLWHLSAAEHMEMVRVGTYRIDVLSNQFSPLWQKYSGFDAVEGSRAAGGIGNKIAVDNKLGFLSPDFDKSVGGRTQGHRNVESGHLKSISSAGGKACGPIVGKRNAESGRMNEVQKLSVKWMLENPEWMSNAGKKNMHSRWHVKRNIVSSICSFCQAV